MTEDDLVEMKKTLKEQRLLTILNSDGIGPVMTRPWVSLYMSYRNVWNCSVIWNSKVVPSDSVIKRRLGIELPGQLKTSCKTTLQACTLPLVFGKEWLFDGAGHILSRTSVSAAQFCEKQKSPSKMFKDCWEEKKQTLVHNVWELHAKRFEACWWGCPCSADISSPPWGLEPDSTKFASKMAKMLPPLDGQWTKSTNFHFIIWSVGKKEDKAKALTLLPPKIRFSAGKKCFERFHGQVSDILENMSQCLRMDRHMFFCSFSVVLRQEIFSSCPLCRKCFSQFFQLPCIQIKFDKKNLPRQPSQYLH